MNINHIKVYVCTRHFWLKQLKINSTYPEINMLVLLKKNIPYAQPSLKIYIAPSAQLYHSSPRSWPFIGNDHYNQWDACSHPHSQKFTASSHNIDNYPHISYSPGALPTGHRVLQTFPKCFRAPPFIKTSVIYGHHCRTLTSFTNWVNPSCIDFKIMSTWTLVDVSDIV